ncbi:MAG: hypothetical protein DLM69_00075 [Candidatus Chloroheliales bacterium]|nr:MAG: hypothetical protein DLM69_00075 [Chloroflexota bacterium]
MIEAYYVAAFWTPRQETLDECTSRTYSYMSYLAKLDYKLTRWFDVGKTKKQFDLKREVKVVPNFIREFLLKGQNHNDKGEVIERLGFSLSMWDGIDQEEGTALRINCGSYSLSNRCILNLPSKGPVAERMIDKSLLISVMENTITSWEPDWAFVQSDKYRSTIRVPRHGGPYIGWMLYLSKQRGAVPPLPPPTRVEPVRNLGSLIILTEERFTADNPAHVELAAKVQDILEKAGLLGPLR